MRKASPVKRRAALLPPGKTFRYSRDICAMLTTELICLYIDLLQYRMCDGRTGGGEEQRKIRYDERHETVINERN